MTDVWAVSADQTHATVTGRVRVPLKLKLSPSFWFQNNFNQTLAEAPWYEPDKPQAQRELDWNMRNPAQNLRAVILGVQDKNYNVRGKAPVRTIQRNDLHDPVTGAEEHGWQWAILSGGDLWVPRLWISYSGTRVVWYLGWNCNGFFGAKFNIHTEGVGYNTNAPKP